MSSDDAGAGTSPAPLPEHITRRMTMSADAPTIVTDTPAVLDHAVRAGQASAFDGISVRDFYAAHALTGYLAAHAGDEIAMPARAEAAAKAYQFADEMLKARSS